ncbi:hypothetical protein CEK28_05030 [Xenophilus sp. AP218F]|nr:hypothetical protein CEK28_05030 [Xenophilus sp. AP218F]
MSDALPPRRGLSAIHKHLRQLRQASPRSRLAAALAGLLAFILLLIYTIALDIHAQRQAFQQTAQQALQLTRQRLQQSQSLQDDASDIIRSGQPGRHGHIRALAREARLAQPQLYYIGYQPLVRARERGNYEAQMSHMLGRRYQIRDYLHDQTNSWTRSGRWQIAPPRPRYLPLSMAEPGLASPDWQEIGLDLLHDSVLGPAAQQALAQHYAASPVLRLRGGEAGVALFQTLYRHETPSPIPMIRSEQAIGVIMQIIYLKPLLTLPPAQEGRYALALIPRAGETGNDPIRIDGPRQTDDGQWLARWLLPALKTRLPLQNSALPYDLAIRRQLQFDRLAPAEVLLLALFAAVPAYLLLIILSLLETHRQSQERARDELFREREYAMVALRSIDDAVISIDVRAVVQYLNPAAETLLGVDSAHALQQPVHQVVDLHYEFSRQAMEDPVAATLSSRQMTRLAQNCYLKRRNGERLLIEGSASPLFNRGGELIGAVLALRDTAPIRRRMLAALEASESRLRQHEQELARVARINTMGEMASGIAHELNQPLSAIMSYCQAGLTLLDDEDCDPQLLRRALTSSVNQADRAGQIIHRLREFVVKKNPQLSPVPLHQSVHNALGLLDYELQTHQVHIEHDFSSDLPLVYADSIQLEQVILNLIRNAIDAMEHTHPWGRLRIATRQQGQRVELTIADNGSGIDEDKLDRIFDPFFSTKPSGLGLGLAICQSTIEAFGGKLSARNRSVCGAEFTIDLPCMPQCMAQPAGAEA